ncbi:MAG TPA: hypothetical protein VFC07_16410, partial [Verrucomicrobiae bacterium]|nr:hypothetical protein [Verrucomicrobiae bacterium]
YQRHDQPFYHTDSLPFALIIVLMIRMLNAFAHNQKFFLAAKRKAMEADRRPAGARNSFRLTSLGSSRRNRTKPDELDKRLIIVIFFISFQNHKV